MDLYKIGALPIGFSMRLSQDLNAMTNFVNLPDNKKEELILYIQSATNGEDAKNKIEEVLGKLS